MTPLRFSTPAPPCLYSTAAADILLDKRLLAPRSTVPHTHTHTQLAPSVDRMGCYGCFFSDGSVKEGREGEGAEGQRETGECLMCLSSS